MVVERRSKAGAGRNRGLLAGGLLVGVGGMLAFGGVVLIGAALVSMTRRRVSRLERPPKEIARLKLRQARSAASAGRDAWRKESASWPQPR